MDDKTHRADLAPRSDILTKSGTYFSFLDPENSVFTIEDVAHGLANTCRFAGQCREFYSVAQHSVLVSQLVRTEFALEGLIHDAAEAFLGDVTRPLKALLPEYKAIEKRVEPVVHARFGISFIPDCVKRADLIALYLEQKFLMPDHDDEWPCLSGIGPEAERAIGAIQMLQPLCPWRPAIAKNMFLSRFNHLTKTSQPWTYSLLD